VLLLAGAVSLAACGEPLEFPDWTIPPPDGTRVVEYAGVPDSEREGVVELERELVIGGEADENYAFYNVVLLDEDMSMRRLSHFDLEGNPLGETALDSEIGFFEGEGLPGGDIVALKQEMVTVRPVELRRRSRCAAPP
jgi:predicted small lipoprotein YifL